VLSNLERILAIEWFNASQALDFRRPKKTSSFLEKLFSEYRKEVPFIENDTVMYKWVNRSVSFVQNLPLNKEA